MELLRDAAYAGRVERGADVDADRKQTDLEGDETLLQVRPLWQAMSIDNKLAKCDTYV